jgi:DNA-binding GntR family transcriptional regulator
VEIDHDAEEFPYLQLAAQLRERIASGDLPPGRAIPSIQRLVQEAGLSVMTIRRAIAVLEAEELVSIRPGRGTFVTKP